MTKFYKSLPFLILLLIQNSYAVETATVDSVKSYRLGEIIVTSDKESKKVSPTTIQNIPYQTINRADAISVSSLASRIPAAISKTNSRGETLLFMRGAAERQICMFLDGVPMNVPWDNRMDMSFVPADIIGNIAIHKGAGSVLYGPNTIGGAVNISTIERKSDGMGADLRLNSNDANSQYISLTHDNRMGDFNYIVNVSYLKSDGFLLSNKTEGLINQNPNSKLRTNTDQERLSAYLRAEFELSEATSLGLSFNHINSEKGVTPEGHVLAEDARFWRYPLWRRSIAALNAEHVFSEKSHRVLKAAVWFDKFDQKIDYYDDISYSNSSQSEDLDESNYGARVSFQTQAFGDDMLTFAFTGFISDNTFQSDKEGLFDYVQKTYSGGAEYRKTFGSLMITAGASLDGNMSEKQESEAVNVLEEDDLSAVSSSLGFKYFLDEDYNLFAAIMNKTRFPTLREKYSTGGGKFIVNKELGPETGLLNEIGVNAKIDNFEATFVVFANFYDDLIAKATVYNSEGGKKKQRENVDKSRTLGLETVLSYSPMDNLDLALHFTYMNAKKEQDGRYDGNLEYIPEIISAFNAVYAFPFGLEAMAELEYTGKQTAQNDFIGDWDEIDPTMITNLRFAYKIPYSDIMISEVYIRANNIFDTYKLSQFGIPDPGRMFIAGMNVRL